MKITRKILREEIDNFIENDLSDPLSNYTDTFDDWLDRKNPPKDEKEQILRYQKRLTSYKNKAKDLLASLNDMNSVFGEHPIWFKKLDDMTKEDVSKASYAILDNALDYVNANVNIDATISTRQEAVELRKKNADVGAAVEDMLRKAMTNCENAKQTDNYEKYLVVDAIYNIVSEKYNTCYKLFDTLFSYYNQLIKVLTLI